MSSVAVTAVEIEGGKTANDSGESPSEKFL